MPTIRPRLSDRAKLPQTMRRRISPGRSQLAVGARANNTDEPVTSSVVEANTRSVASAGKVLTRTWRQIGDITSALAFCSVVTACDEGLTKFEFAHGPAPGGTTYVAATSDRGLIETARIELAKPLVERRLHISGPIAKGDGHENAPWHWHFVHDRWELVQVSVEVCDANPKYVDQNLDHWLETVGRYCPWASRVLRELE